MPQLAAERTRVELDREAEARRGGEVAAGRGDHQQAVAASAVEPVVAERQVGGQAITAGPAAAVLQLDLERRRYPRAGATGDRPVEAPPASGSAAASAGDSPWTATRGQPSPGPGRRRSAPSAPSRASTVSAESAWRSPRPSTWRRSRPHAVGLGVDTGPYHGRGSVRRDGMVGRQRAAAIRRRPMGVRSLLESSDVAARPGPSSPARRAGGRPRTRGALAASAAARHPWPGEHFPLGAHWDGKGTNFALFSANAERVELVLANPDGSPRAVYELTDRTDLTWHGYLPGVGPGTLYGYRVDGPYEPAAGRRFNPGKLLIDPYARALTGAVDVGPRGLRLRVEPADDRRRPERAQLRRPRPPLGGGRQPLRLAGDPAPAHPLGRHPRLRGPRQGLHDAPPRRAASGCAAPTPASAIPPPSSTSGRSASPPSS